MTDSPSREQEVLAELERLQAQIEASRRRRREASDEFEAWVRSIRSRASVPEGPAPPPESGRMAAALRAKELPRTGPRPAGDPPAIDPASAPPVVGTPKVDTAEVETPEAGTPETGTPEAGPPRSASHAWRARAAAAALAAAVVVVLGLAWYRDTRRPETPAGTAVVPGGAAPSPAGQAAPPPAAARAVTEPAAVPPAELITERRVWVRVLVDGERVVERELEANTRIPLRGRKQLVVRAGDAGAVRIAIAGRDQGRLGSDGVVVTRTFDLPR